MIPDERLKVMQIMPQRRIMGTDGKYLDVCDMEERAEMARELLSLREQKRKLIEDADRLYQWALTSQRIDDFRGERSHLLERDINKHESLMKELDA